MKKRKFLFLLLVAGMTVVLVVSPVIAGEQYTVFGNPLNLTGYITQGLAFSLSDKDRYDTEKGLQSALMNLFLEMDYKISPQLKFYTSERLSVDWIYQLNHNDDSWHDKLFNKSKGHLNVDDKYWQILNEAHFTWTPGNFFFFRVGKQIVSWGEMDGFRLMDQINPLDSRRGFADVEFENTIIPIWLIRMEFYPRITTKWLQDSALEFVFNPNADFIPNQDIAVGNDAGGIWSPNVVFPDPTAPFGEVRYGSYITDLNEPKNFNHKGYEYAFRVKALVKDTIVTLNGFYGLDNSPILKFKDPLNPYPLITTAYDGRLLLHPSVEGHFPRFKFIGATASRDLPFLAYTPIGGVAPVVRLETWYGFNNTFTDYIKFVKSDEFRMALGVDWKIKIPFLNPKAYFSISPQVYYRCIFDRPHNEEWFDAAGARVTKHNWITSLYISTAYFNSKLVPSLYWMHDFETNSEYFRLQVTYDWKTSWRFTIGSMLFAAEKLPDFKEGNGFSAFDHKDQIYFKVSYKW